jgi:3-deoxy-manno-octulosonate cytidylyltransferase (CMP-KDO synthetase)
MNFGIVTARYDSSRFPGKAVADIDGKPLIQRVVDQALSAESLDYVVVATEDERIADVVTGCDVLLTSKSHRNGTERCGEVSHRLGLADHTTVVSIQGDQPFIDPSIIDSVVGGFSLSRVQGFDVATPYVWAYAGGTNKNDVKVATDLNDHALFFSRSVIPFGAEAVKKHIGVYVLHAKLLSVYAELQPTPLETAESLEQLRFLENGFTIKMVGVEKDVKTINAPEDMEGISG